MKNLKTAASIGIMLSLIVLFILYLNKHFADFEQLASAGISNIWFIAVLFLLIVGNLFLNGKMLKYLLLPFGIKLKELESFAISVITSFYNLITPFRGGAGARAFYLNKKHNFSYTHFLSTLSAVYILAFLVGSFAGLASIFFIWFYYGLFNIYIFILLTGISSFLLFVIIFPFKLKKRKNKWLNRFVNVINGWHLIRNNKKIVSAALANSIVQLIFGAIIIIITYSIFNIDIGVSKATFIAAISVISLLVSITPGNIGIGDAIDVFSANIIGIDVTGAISATVLKRAILLLVLFILGPIFSFILFKKTGKNYEESAE